jgi:anti-sigma regulatory factor (Ser/Thr protein kinase)
MRHTPHTVTGTVLTPKTIQKAVALAHLRVAEWEPDDDDEEVVPIPALPTSPPQFLPVPSAWWETPAITCRPLSPVPEEARTARQFVRELLTCWGLDYLSDDAELIIAELVGNAVRHGLRTAPQVLSAGAEPSSLRLCLLRRVGEVMLAVTDPSDEAPTPRAPSYTGENGRGLQIVGALSYVWGWSPIEGHGKAVWAVLKSYLPGDRHLRESRALTGTPSPYRNAESLPGRPSSTPGKTGIYPWEDRHSPGNGLVRHRKHVLDQGDQDVLR